MANTDRRDLNQLIVIRILVLCGIAAFLVGSSRGNNIKTPITYHVEEELSPRLLIGNLIQDAVLTELYSAEELASLEFTFISSQEAHEELFNLTRDGTLLTRIVIDRDVLCPAEENCILSLDVEVSPVEYFQIIKINVVILDINDNRPTFQQPRIHLSLAESTPVGSLLQVPMAYDPDSPANGIDHYEVHIRDNSSRSVFGLKTNGDLQGSPGEIYLEILNYLDREEKSSYVLELTATERNVQDLKQSILIIQVSVTDVNDNMPVFTQSKYTVTVPENVHIGTALVKVMATDMDSGENSRIRYLLSSRSADNYDLMFRVDELTGEIYTQESLDYEERSQYTLIVVAVDSQVNGLTGETTVIVNVKDVNDNAPIIRITSLGKHPPKVEIPENSELMTPIAHVSIEDPDEEMGGVVSCIVNDTKFSLTQIYANDFMLRSAEILDREMTSKFYVMITCKDRGQPELVSWKTIDINVLDVNDNRPMFGQTHYQVIISADIHIGDNIFQLSATDPDEGDNGNVAYSILDPDVVHLFSINKQSGIVSANVNISNISIWDFKIHILAEDMGDEPLSSTTILILSSLVNQSSSNINLLSQNNVTVLHVEENWPENIKIGQLFDDNEHLVCDITTVVYPDEIKKLFVLSNNGEVIVQTSLDRETQETYYFGAIVKKVCRNSAGEQESVKGYIIQVIVDDQNDNAPIVIFPNSENNTITLHPGLVNERLLLAKIKGTDADVEENSRLTFTLVNPERFDYLRLNPDSGELYVIGEVRDDIESKLVRIKLTDNGSPSLSTTATLRINLTSAAVISNPETMVTADNLTKVLSITLPCSVILVLVIILIVRLTRKTFSCRTKKKDRNHVNPTTKLNLAADDPDAEKQKLSAIYTALGLHPSNGIDYLYPEKDLSACLTDIAEQLTGDKCTDLGFTQVGGYGGIDEAMPY
ncbi:hypothetical protein LSH36_53g01012 [Paralvinella palmiformis]|uniref:Cadherin domain-containing protein n=1 Tax=Paralvinella palmiformis TaxID=53620 RepID=A0AAD9NCR3_9ANNE|nr:hypothetical protein LSH36_53g01012 [Paralvinella palmiformis]